MNRVLGAACAAIAAVPLIAIAAASAPVAAAPPGAPRVTLMGDSTLMAMEYYPNLSLIHI